MQTLGIVFDLLLDAHNDLSNVVGSAVAESFLFVNGSDYTKHSAYRCRCCAG